LLFEAPMPSRNPATGKEKSGGAKAWEKEQRARNGSRPEGWAEREIAQFERIFRKTRSAGALGIIERHIEALDHAAKKSYADPGLTPEYRREQGGRLSAAVLKEAQLKKIIDEMGAELREAYVEITQLKALVVELRGRNAAQKPAPDPRGTPSGPTH
jgi:hypothetical protein